ncbi:MAG: ectonucleotide pyrophosphatase/phosphodiesterase, partial [Kaistella sp.]
GYNPYKVPEMKSAFVASGPAFKKGKKIGEFRNVNIYPMIAEILSLKITEPIDGKNCTAEKVLQ